MRVDGPALRTIVGVASLIASVTVASAATVTDASDLWWSAEESGWGMQVVQEGNVIFATLYVYDINGNGSFFSATLDPSADAWSGPLLQTSGPYFALPQFDPAQVRSRNVGTMNFALTSAVTATLLYTVDGATTTKSLQRQLLRYVDTSGSYAATVQRVTTNCPNSAVNGDGTFLEYVDIVQSGTDLRLNWRSATRTCMLNGTYDQAGKRGSAATAYLCSDAEVGSMALSEITRNGEFITAIFQGHSITNGCDYRGQFAGLVVN